MKTSIIIPVFNEARTIKQVIDNVLALPFDKEVIVVDDCSTDDTCKIVCDALLGKPQARVYHLLKNQGKGAALREGIKYASGQIIVFQDADLEYDPRDIASVIAPILAGECAVCYGSRMNSPGFLSPTHKTINRFLSNLTSQSVNDMETGMKAFRSELIKGMKLESTGFEIEPEITIKLLQQDIRIKEVPISYNARTKAEGKKIGFLDGVKALLTIGKLRLKYARCVAS